MFERVCGDCGANPGDLHMPGCDMEICARCGCQSISCDCIYEVTLGERVDLETEYPEIYEEGPTEEMYKQWDAEWDSRRIPWAGEAASAASCREYGFWCYWSPDARGPGKGSWIECAAGHELAREDLNRIHMKCEWSIDQQKWVLRDSATQTRQAPPQRSVDITEETNNGEG